MPRENETDDTSVPLNTSELITGQDLTELFGYEL
jgi:hypothetical protein